MFSVNLSLIIALKSYDIITNIDDPCTCCFRLIMTSYLVDDVFFEEALAAEPFFEDALAISAYLKPRE
jgi:hypothetical protein